MIPLRIYSIPKKKLMSIYKKYSGGIRGGALVSPSSMPNYLFTAKNIFFLGMAQCILMYLTPGVTREKIHVGVNSLTKLYKI